MMIMINTVNEIYTISLLTKQNKNYDGHYVQDIPCWTGFGG